MLVLAVRNVPRWYNLPDIQGEVALTRKTTTFRTSGLASGTLMGLVLLLCPGVGVLLREVK